MLNTIMKNWKLYGREYEWKGTVDKRSRRNMDIYAADVFKEEYLPKYSARELDADYEDRLQRAENGGFMNFPQKIVDIYRNSVFRSGAPNREGDSPEAKRFIQNVDGAGTDIGSFIRDRVFLLDQIHGGLFIVVDKPKAPEGRMLTLKDKQDLGLFPYAYIYMWEDMYNYGLDRFGGLEWILFKEKYIDENGDKAERLRYFDKTEWALLDKEGQLMDSGEHGLRRVPVYRHFQRANPKHRFQTPVTALDDVFRLTLKTYEAQSQLEQMIINHVFMKLAMPTPMFEALKNEGAGNKNVLLFPPGLGTDKAYYVQSEFQEIKELKDLVFRLLPDKILYFATVRDKVSMPREESGTAKFIDSSEEISNLLDKANSMERAENAIIALARAWEGDEKEYSVTYNKVFDIKSTNEQIEEIVKIFKQDMGSPKFNKTLVKRLMFNLLGEVSEKVRKEIEREIDEGIDPSLSIEDLDLLASRGFVDAVKLARKYNPQLKGKTEEEVKAFIQGNISMMVGVTAQPTDSVPLDISSEGNISGGDGAPITLNGIQISAAKGIIKDVSSGELPRDSGINQLMTFLNLTREQAERVMGKAGTGKIIKKDKVINSNTGGVA